MQKKINIDQIPGVFKGYILMNDNNAKTTNTGNKELKEMFLSNLDREIGFYREMQVTDEDETMKEACSVIIKLLETAWSIIYTIDENHKHFKCRLKKITNKLIGHFGFREQISVIEEEKALFKEVIDTMEILIEDIHYR